MSRGDRRRRSGGGLSDRPGKHATFPVGFRGDTTSASRHNNNTVAAVLWVGAAAHAQEGNPTDSDNDGKPDGADSCPQSYGTGYDGCPTEGDIEEVVVVGDRQINLITKMGQSVDCTSPSNAWTSLCSGFSVPRFGAWFTQSPTYSGIWDPSWRTRNDHISCPAGSRPKSGQEQSWRCVCAPGFRNVNGGSGLPCITNAEFLDNAGPPPVCLCGQPTIPYDHTTWVLGLPARGRLRHYVVRRTSRVQNSDVGIAGGCLQDQFRWGYSV